MKAQNNYKEEIQEYLSGYQTIIEEILKIDKKKKNNADNFLRYKERLISNFFGENYNVKVFNNFHNKFDVDLTINRYLDNAFMRVPGRSYFTIDTSFFYYCKINHSVNDTPLQLHIYAKTTTVIPEKDMDKTNWLKIEISYELFNNERPYNFRINSIKKAQPPINSDTDPYPDYCDECKKEDGIDEYNGCPERVIDESFLDWDNDGILNPNDSCKYVIGKKCTFGCPDTDNDCIRDSMDLCRYNTGTSSKGCPEEYRFKKRLFFHSEEPINSIQLIDNYIVSGTNRGEIGLSIISQDGEIEFLDKNRILGMIQKIDIENTEEFKVWFKRRHKRKGNITGYVSFKINDSKKVLEKINEVLGVVLPKDIGISKRIDSITVLYPLGRDTLVKFSSDSIFWLSDLENILILSKKNLPPTIYKKLFNDKWLELDLVNIEKIKTISAVSLKNEYLILGDDRGGIQLFTLQGKTTKQ